MQNNEPLPTLACGKKDKTLILLKNGCYKKKTITSFSFAKKFSFFFLSSKVRLFY